MLLLVSWLACFELARLVIRVYAWEWPVIGGAGKEAEGAVQSVGKKLLMPATARVVVMTRSH